MGGRERERGEQWGEEIRIPGLTRRTNRGAATLPTVPEHSRVGIEGRWRIRGRIPAPAPRQISDASRLTPSCIRDPPRWYS